MAESLAPSSRDSIENSDCSAIYIYLSSLMCNEKVSKVHSLLAGGQ